jgi:hypothetical protein
VPIPLIGTFRPCRWRTTDGAELLGRSLPIDLSKQLFRG